MMVIELLLSLLRTVLLIISLIVGFNINLCYANSEVIPVGVTPLAHYPKLKMRMLEHQPKQCHQALNEMDLVKVKYYGYDSKTHTGVLLVNQEISKELHEIFQELYKHKFPIQKIRPLGGTHNDSPAVRANYTATYNCRNVTGQPGILSQHSFGRAIDINPVANPYVKGDIIIPPSGKPYIDRTKEFKGKITKDSLLYKLFTERGWDWGGSWFDLLDYQHFEKRANGEKRNPYGYTRLR